MADSKISNLPEVTTPSSSDVLPIVNGGATKKVTVQNLGGVISSPQGASAYSTVNSLSSFWTPSIFIARWLSSGTPGYRNMPLNNFNLINFNTTVTNTDTSNYLLELGNSNNAIDGKILIQKTGGYFVNIFYNSFDTVGGSQYPFYIYTNVTSKGTSSSHYSTLTDGYAAGGAGVRQSFSATGLIYITTVPTWISIVINPTGSSNPSGPYPSDGTTGSTTQPPEVEIFKVY